jgi:hypothetical protein
MRSLTIPPEVVEAAAREICKRDCGFSLDALDRPTKDKWRDTARAAIAAALAAWPGMAIRVMPYDALILPLPQQEARDE